MPLPAARYLPVTALLAVSWLLGAGAARSPLAAQSGPLATLIPSLFNQTIVLDNTGHQAHFIDSSNVLREAGLQINRSVVSQLSTFPVSSSGGGFTFSFDPELGVFTRTTGSFGPLFAERPETVGRGKWSFGVNHSRFSYDSLGGFDLDEGDLTLSFTHLDVNHDGTTVETFVEGDYISAEALLELDHSVTVFSINYGLFDRFDVAIAVPLVSVEMSASLNTHIERFATSGLEPAPHLFPDGSDGHTFVASGEESGVGDILLRAKYKLATAEGRGLAAAADLRLPTGDEDNLLGSGSTQLKLLLIGSMGFGRIYPHFNAGYTLSSGGSDLIGDLPDEVNFTAGFDAAVHERVTLAADLIWRTLLDANRIEKNAVVHRFTRWDTRQVLETTRPTLETERQDLNIIQGSMGMKLNIAGQLLLNANLLMSFSDDGLTEKDLSPLVGLEYSF